MPALGQETSELCRVQRSEPEEYRAAFSRRHQRAQLGQPRAGPRRWSIWQRTHRRSVETAADQVGPSLPQKCPNFILIRLPIEDDYTDQRF